MSGRGHGHGWSRVGMSLDESDKVPPERRGHTVRRIAGFFRPYRRRVTLVLLTIVVTSLLGLALCFGTVWWWKQQVVSQSERESGGAASEGSPTRPTSRRGTAPGSAA